MVEQNRLSISTVYLALWWRSSIKTLKCLLLFYADIYLLLADVSLEISFVADNYFHLFDR